MKKTILTVLSLLLVSLSVYSAKPLDTKIDHEAIKKTILNYIEGWYEGNAERMEKALHPDLAKRGVFTIKATGKTYLQHASASAMVEYTRAGMGKLKAGEKMDNEVTVLDVYENTAAAKAVSKDFIDYIHLAKCNGEWLIVNVLWEMKK